jgi:hypothetical protein
MTQFDDTEFQEVQHTHRPIFEIITPDGHEYKIWSTGKIEGFPENSIVNNRIHGALGAAYMKGKTFDGAA